MRFCFALETAASGGPAVCGSPGLHFHKRQNRAVPTDQVELPRAGAGAAISRHNRITRLAQVPIGQGFAARAGFQMLRFASRGWRDGRLRAPVGVPSKPTPDT